ncbi:MAG: hypothetical protein AAF039_10195 [Bacteroidota bacterium]
MIAGQRKAHKLIWLGMALAIPIVLFFAVRNLTFTEAISGTSPSGQLKARFDTDRITITLNTSFKSPSAVVYALDKEGKIGRPLGQLSAPGTYSFRTSDKVIGVVVVDKIKEQELYKIKF